MNCLSGYYARIPIDIRAHRTVENLTSMRLDELSQSKLVKTVTSSE